MFQVETFNSFSDALKIDKKSKPKETNFFKSDQRFMRHITDTEMNTVVAGKGTQRIIKRLADDGLQYLKQKQINLWLQK